MMKIFFCLAALVFTFFSCYAEQAGSQAATQLDQGAAVQNYEASANIAPGEQENKVYDTWDFGRVKKGQVLEHNFLFTNDAQKTITIEGVDTSCGCTVSEVGQKVLAPGEKTLVKVTFKTQGYFGPTQQHIYVRTNNSENPVFKLTIKADVE